MTTKQAALCTGGVFLTFLLVQCSTARVKPAAVVPAASPAAPSETQALAASPAAVKSDLPDYFSRQREQALELLLRDADTLFVRGRQLFETGRIEEGRYFFEQSLEILRGSGFPPGDYPKLNIALQGLSADINRLEVRATAEQVEPPLPSEQELGGDASPLDEIAELDLFEIEIDPALENLVGEDLKSIKFDFPVVVNKEVLKFLDYYQGRGRKAMEAALKRSGRYMPEFRRIFQEEGLPLDLIYMAHVESLFKTRAYSRARARGLWQFVKGTARMYGLKTGWWVDERLDVLKATRVAARHLKDLNTEFGDWYLALAGYNGGPGRVARVLRKHGRLDYWEMARRNLLPRETRNYVPSILAAIIIYKHPEQYGFDAEPDPPLQWEAVPVEFQVDLKVVSEAIGVEPSSLADLNPELLREITPPTDGVFQLRVPYGKAGLARQKLAEIPPEQRLRLRHHRVEQGETLSHIAAKYGISIRAIAETNRLRNVNRLSLGQELVIPLSDWRAASGRSAPVDADAERHTVRQGDSLYKIAHSYGVSLDNLFKWNNLGPRSVLHPGQEIRLRATGRENE